LVIAVAVVFVLSLLAVTILAMLLISAGRAIADGIIRADQPDALANGWLVVATAFVTGVAPLIALGAAVGRALTGSNIFIFTDSESDTGGEGDQGTASGRYRRRNLPLPTDPVVPATAIAAAVQLFVLLSGAPDVSPETQAVIVAGVTALAGLYIRQRALA
jgi:hypothetical protein